METRTLTEANNQNVENGVESEIKDMAPIKAPGKSWMFMLLLLVVMLIIIGGWLVAVSISGRLKTGRPNGGGNTVTPTIGAEASPTLTILRTPSAIASQSAFLELDAAVNSLTAAVGGFVVQDLTLTPPILDIKLGFTN